MDIEWHKGKNHTLESQQGDLRIWVDDGRPAAWGLEKHRMWMQDGSLPLGLGRRLDAEGTLFLRPRLCTPRRNVTAPGAYATISRGPGPSWNTRVAGGSFGECTPKCPARKSRSKRR